MRFTDLLGRQAARDLEDIFHYIESHDGFGPAQRVLDEIGAAFQSLSEMPRRGAHPPELLALGVSEYREVLFKPYRIIYRVLEQRVEVALISDGRRDMRTLLQRRLLAGRADPPNA